MVYAEPAVPLSMELLKVAADGGQKILLSANAYAASSTAAFAGEINDLLGQGYGIVDEGWRMVYEILERDYGREWSIKNSRDVGK